MTAPPTPLPPERPPTECSLRAKAEREHCGHWLHESEPCCDCGYEGDGDDLTELSCLGVRLPASIDPDAAGGPTAEWYRSELDSCRAEIAQLRSACNVALSAVRGDQTPTFGTLLSARSVLEHALRTTAAAAPLSPPTDPEPSTTGLRCPRCGAPDAECSEDASNHYHRCVTCGAVDVFKGGAPAPVSPVEPPEDPDELCAHVDLSVSHGDDVLCSVRRRDHVAEWPHPFQPPAPVLLVEEAAPTITDALRSRDKIIARLYAQRDAAEAEVESLRGKRERLRATLWDARDFLAAHVDWDDPDAGEHSMVQRIDTLCGDRTSVDRNVVPPAAAGADKGGDT